jgi:hypothetical protein
MSCVSAETSVCVQIKDDVNMIERTQILGDEEVPVSCMASTRSSESRSACHPKCMEVESGCPQGTFQSPHHIPKLNESANKKKEPLHRVLFQLETQECQDAKEACRATSI